MHAVFCLNHAADRILQFVNASHRSIPGLTAVDAVNRGIPNVLRSFAIGLPHAKIDNADAVSLEFLGFGID
jgi:hypothetical protein